MRSMLALAIFENDSGITVKTAKRNLTKDERVTYGIRKDTRITDQDFSRALDLALQFRRCCFNQGSTARSLLRQVRDLQPSIRRDTLMKILADYSRA